MSNELSAKIISITQTELPAEITSVLEHIEKCRKEAKETPGKAIRVSAGYYFLFTNNVMWEIDSSTERQINDRWLARTEDDVHGAKTLKELVNYLTSEVYEKLKSNFDDVYRYQDGVYEIKVRTDVNLSRQVALSEKIAEIVGTYKTLSTKSYVQKKSYIQVVKFRI